MGVDSNDPVALELKRVILLWIAELERAKETATPEKISVCLLLSLVTAWVLNAG